MLSLLNVHSLRAALTGMGEDLLTAAFLPSQPVGAESGLATGNSTEVNGRI